MVLIEVAQEMLITIFSVNIHATILKRQLNILIQEIKEFKVFRPFLRCFQVSMSAGISPFPIIGSRISARTPYQNM